MKSYEESNNEAKEEHLEFNSKAANEMSMFGTWVGADADERMRIKRASGLSDKVKGSLKGTQQSKRWCHRRG